MLPTPDAIPNRADAGRLAEVLDQFDALEAQFQSLRAQLTHCHRLSTLGTLTSIIAHEYNNILTPIISYAQLALASPGDRALLVKAVEKALAGAERAATMSASILGFAREADPQAQQVAHLPTVARESVQCLGRDPRKDGIDLHIDLPEVAAAIPPLQLQQVFVNLILNAREAMKRGGRLEMTGRVTPQGVAIDVRDTGPGIPPSLRDRIFEPFVTTKAGDDEDARDGGPDEHAPGAKKGTGLGLCISRDLVRQAGGDLTVLAQAANALETGVIGAAFRITLPVAV